MSRPFIANFESPNAWVYGCSCDCLFLLWWSGAGKIPWLISKGMIMSPWWRTVWIARKISNQDSWMLCSVLGKLTKPMHNNRIKHGCLYGKHLFVKELQAQQDALKSSISSSWILKSKKIWPKRLAIVKRIWVSYCVTCPGLTLAPLKITGHYFADSDLTAGDNASKSPILASA